MVKKKKEALTVMENFISLLNVVISFYLSIYFLDLLFWFLLFFVWGMGIKVQQRSEIVQIKWVHECQPYLLYHQ